MPRGWVISSWPSEDDRPRYSPAARPVQLPAPSLGSGCRELSSALSSHQPQASCPLSLLGRAALSPAEALSPSLSMPSILPLGQELSPVQAVRQVLTAVEHQAGEQGDLAGWKGVVLL